MSYAVAKRRAEEAAAQQTTTGDELRCGARGCPMRWSVNMGNGTLCSWHDSAERHEWPRITGELTAIVSGGGKPVLPMLRAKKHVAPTKRPPQYSPTRVGDALPALPA